MCGGDDVSSAVDGRYSIGWVSQKKEKERDTRVRMGEWENG